MLYDHDRCLSKAQGTAYKCKHIAKLLDNILRGGLCCPRRFLPRCRKKSEFLILATSVRLFVEHKSGLDVLISNWEISLPGLEVSSKWLILYVYACIHSKSNFKYYRYCNMEVSFAWGWSFCQNIMIFMHVYLRHVHSHRVCVCAPLWVCLVGVSSVTWTILWLGWKFPQGCSFYLSICISVLDSKMQDSSFEAELNAKAAACQVWKLRLCPLRTHFLGTQFCGLPRLILCFSVCFWLQAPGTELGSVKACWNFNVPGAKTSLLELHRNKKYFALQLPMYHTNSILNECICQCFGKSRSIFYVNRVHRFFLWLFSDAIHARMVTLDAKRSSVCNLEVSLHGLEALSNYIFYLDIRMSVLCFHACCFLTIESSMWCKPCQMPHSKMFQQHSKNLQQLHCIACEVHLWN